MTTSASSETATATRVLDGIRSPADIKALSEQDLPQLAQEVREELIKCFRKRAVTSGRTSASSN